MRYLVWGLGKSGKAAVKLLESKGKNVVYGDDSDGSKVEDFISNIDVIVVSPGIPPSHKIFQLARIKGIEVISEIELAYRFFGGSIIAITGTDGKTTTTRLIYTILSKTLKDVSEGGNIGKPFSEIVLENPNCTAVLEISSFQAKNIDRFKPDIAVFTNFSEDHLDWHPSKEDYLLSKYKLFKNQTETDIAVLNKLCREVRETPTKAMKRFFNDKENIYYDSKDGFIYLYGKKIIDVSKIKLLGRHNIDNIMAAILVSYLKDVPLEAIVEEVYKFEGLPYRLSLVTKYNGISIYNDSKSTTLNSLRAAVDTFEDGKVILIAGGILKGGDLSQIIPLIKRKVKKCIVFGRSAEMFLKEWKDYIDIERVLDIEEAVRKAFLCAEPEDIILFSPGCSSFDMFKNYIERGEAFNSVVKRFISTSPLPS